MQPVQRDALITEYQKNGIYGKDKTDKNATLDADISPVDDQGVIELMIKAAVLLTDTKFMVEGFRALETAMIDLYKIKSGLTSVTFTGFKGVKPLKDLGAKVGDRKRPKDDASRHLMSEVLHNFEEAHQFASYPTINGHPRIVQMTGLLSAESFKKTSMSGHMAKDYVTKDHGVYSHRIQWYCLARNKDFATGTGKLYTSFFAGGAWKLTFDRLLLHARLAGTTLVSDDFRTPENVNAHLKQPLVYPILGGYLAAKADGTKSFDWTFVRYGVVAKKMYPEVSGLDEWKTWKKAEFTNKLTLLLGNDRYQNVVKFCEDENVLVPGQDGKYQKMA